MRMFNISAAPHIRQSTTTAGIMRDVSLSLLPALAIGIYYIGGRAFMITVLAIAGAMLSELIYEKILHMPSTLHDGSAFVTGLLLAMNLPGTVPFYIPLVGSAFAIIVVKMLFGGLGHNFMNPALGGRVFLLISFARIMTDFNFDGVTTATPLARLAAGESVPLKEMILGTGAGCIGETCALALLAGAAYLLIRRVITLRIPATYIITFAIFVLLFGGHGFDVEFLVAQLCGGGLILGAFFMATDYVTSPITAKGQIIFGILLGILTGIFRFFGSAEEGVSYAIIFGNLLVPLIERITMPVPFGREGKKNGK